MALFGKKAKNSPGEATTPGASNIPVADSGADPFAADVFASDDAAAASVDSSGKGGKKSRAAKAPKSSKPKGIKNGSVVGLNIGNSLIKAVEVTAKNGEISVTGVGIVPTPGESYVNGNILSVSALSAALRNLWKQAGFKSKTAVISVSGTGSLVVRVIDVPKMTDGELADNMRVDADRYIPFPPSEVVMDFKALRELPSDPDAPNMEVLLAAAQREVIDLHVKVIQSSKLNPGAIDVEPIATARALQLEKRREGQMVDYDDVTALLNIGATGTEITVLRGDVVVFTRSLPNGGNNLTAAISEAFGVTFPDAERIKVERADALPPAGYDQNAAFGADAFDEFGGGDMNSFSDDVFGSPAGTASQASTTSNTQTATSEDPFDLDFFNQGPKDEPGAGHSQKDGEDTEDNKPIAFNFSFDDDVAAMPSTQNQINATPADPAPPTPPVFDEPPAQLLPAQDSPAPTPIPDVSSTSPINFGFEGNIPTNTGDPHAIPSAFDFSDFDLPTVIEEGSDDEALQAPTFEDTTFSAPPASSFGFAPAHDETPQPTNFQIGEPAAQPAAEDDSPFGDFGFTAAPETETSTPDFGQSPISLDKQPEEVSEIPSFDTGMNFDDIQLGADNSTISGFDIGPDLTGDAFGSAEDMSFGTGLGESVVADADETALYTAIAPVIEELCNEVRRSLEFHLGRYPDTSFSRILLVGGGAKLRNLDVYFTQNIGVPTQVAHPFSFVNVEGTKMPAEAIESSSSLCATALGLALRDFID